jgi:hypothetical protein
MYFDSPGPSNSEAVVNAVREYIAQNPVPAIVVSSNTGKSALLFAGLADIVVNVTHVNGFHEKGSQELKPETRAALTEAGIIVHTAAHSLSGAERSLSRKFSGTYPTEIIASTLRMFGQGTKVGVEISAMALDAGLIPYGQKIIAVGGTGGGVDTALLLTPEYTDSILDTKINEIICKPRL